jgi:hypothetical protein
MSGDERTRVVLKDGRTIRLEALRQWPTNGGWLEGGPSAAWNQRMVERTEKEAAEGALDGRVLTIPPAEIRKINHPNPRFNIEAYPDVTCVGVFHSSTARDPTADGSILTLIWFQDLMALPIAPEVVEAIRAIDWNAQAADYGL